MNHIPYDPDFDPPRGIFSGMPSRTAFIFGMITAIGISALMSLILLI